MLMYCLHTQEYETLKSFEVILRRRREAKTGGGRRPRPVAHTCNPRY
jgi:hypothetical protein